MGRRLPILSILLVTVTLLTLAAGSRAAVVLDETHAFLGSSATAFEFTIASDGEYWLSLEDLSSPRLDSASADVSAPAGGSPLVEAVLSSGGPATAKTRFFASAGLYSANLSGVAAGAGAGNLGVQVSAVPLPPAALLFFGAMTALVAVGRRQRPG